MKKWSALLVLLCCIGLSACGVRTTKDPQAIQPAVKNIKASTMGIPLYFGYKYQPYLGVELRDLSENYDKSVEQLAINELIAGPGEGSELERLIPEGTTAAVSNVGDTLFVTLSQAFFDTVPGEDQDWQKHPSWRTEVYQRRKMAVYSIVNTITEIGNYNRVQILIQDADNPSGYRPKMAELGMAAEDDSRFLDTIARNPESVLNPKNTITGCLSLFQEKQWEQLFNCTSQVNSQNITPVNVYEFTDSAKDSTIILESYTVSDSPVTFTGNGTAMVNISYVTRDKNNHIIEHTQIPMKLVLVNNIWKVEYDSIQKIFHEGSQSS